MVRSCRKRWVLLFSAIVAIFALSGLRQMGNAVEQEGLTVGASTFLADIDLAKERVERLEIKASGDSSTEITITYTDHDKFSLTIENQPKGRLRIKSSDNRGRPFILDCKSLDVRFCSRKQWDQGASR